jgi:hypothetical protein
MGSSLLGLLAIGLGVEIPEIPEEDEESEFIDNILTTLGEPCLDEVCATGHGPWNDNIGQQHLHTVLAKGGIKISC